MGFLFDNGKEYGYEDLLRALNEGKTYYPYLPLNDTLY